MMRTAEEQRKVTDRRARDGAKKGNRGNNDWMMTDYGG